MKELLKPYRDNEDLIEALKAKNVESVEVIYNYNLTVSRLCDVNDLKVLLDREEYIWDVDVLDDDTVIVNFLEV